jgi:putative membrane protein
LFAAIAAVAALFAFSALPTARKLCGLSAAAVLAIAFVSPLCALSSALFSARVAHHVLLIVVAAPLLVLASPPPRRPARPSLGLWTAAHVGTVWIWHAPAAYAWALSGDAPYWLMEGSLLGAAAGFWRAVRGSAAPAAAGTLLAAMVLTGVLGALITFAGRPLYAPHFLTTEPWGLSALTDQQLAGLIMWVPAAIPYLLAELWRIERGLRGEVATVAAT